MGSPPSVGEMSTDVRAAHFAAEQDTGGVPAAPDTGGVRAPHWSDTDGVPKLPDFGGLRAPHWTDTGGVPAAPDTGGVRAPKCMACATTWTSAAPAEESG